MLSIRNLINSYPQDEGKLRVLAQIDFDIDTGSSVALMGESGSGKTTLLNLIAGLEPVQQGKIDVAGLALQQASDKQLSQLRKQHIGIIFQQFNLLTSLSVQDNIEFSAKLAGRYNAEHGLALAEQLGISELLHKYPATLSGGEMQRVAIARALNSRPQLLLADEPTGNLDPKSAIEILEILENINSRGTAVLMATHNYSLIKQFPHQTLSMLNGELKEE